MLSPKNNTPLDRAPRILLYSHDSFGLGHLRRSVSVAGRLAEEMPRASILIATGSPCATRFPLPPGVDVVKLPAAGKDNERGGAYVPRSMGGSLQGLLRLRSRLLLELTKSFRPDLMIVDHKVIGLGGELLPVLAEARQQGTRTLLGMRDILDAPERVACEWADPRIDRALQESYDRILIYGCPRVFDPRTAYGLHPRIARRMSFTGYIVRPWAGLPYRALPELRRSVLLTTGGGEDGADRVEAYLNVVERFQPAWRSVIVLGPLFDPQVARKVKRRARRLDDVRVHLFYEDLPRLIAESSAVVAMAGYNSAVEIMRSRKPVIFLPRSSPRTEQLVRAKSLKGLGLADSLTMDQAQPERLFRCIQGALNQRRVRSVPPPLNGLDHVAHASKELLGLAVPEHERVRSHS